MTGKDANSLSACFIQASRLLLNPTDICFVCIAQSREQ